jgi:hypothetical protein
MKDQENKMELSQARSKKIQESIEKEEKSKTSSSAIDSEPKRS